MSTWNPVSWLSGTALAQDKSSKPFSGRNLTIGLIYGSIIFPAWFWVSQVTKHVPEPYLDEVFHIPQAQKYCDAQYQIWDPKITTPPGLYAFATLFVKLVGGGVCNPYTLRLFNTFVLIMTMAYASACRDLITRLSAQTPSNYPKITKSWLNSHDYISYDTVHTAINLTLFPPLFFFSGLFYTDVLSTAVVLCMYMTFLRRPGAYERSNVGGFRLYVIGLVALTMRQTNIFWVAIFMGGLEAVRTVQSLPTATTTTSSSSTDESSGKIPQNSEEFWAAMERYKRGDIHDVALNDAHIPDFIFCILSIATAILYNPLIVLGRICPYITLLFSFGAFVSWNGGVVLGDKSNHIATIHLPQLLYLTAFTAFFSFPLLLPYLLSYIPSPLHVLIPGFLLPKPQPPNQDQDDNQPRPPTNRLLQLTTILLLTLTTLLIIHQNTLIHPFTLADNRHYVFYVFRYTILRHWAIKYLLAPVYLSSGWLGYKCLSGQRSTKQSTPTTTTSTTTPKKPPKTTSPVSAKTTKQPSTKILQAQAQPHPQSHSSSPKTSFLILYVLTTTLSLITAPLVEPRYFITPWILWRLYVPSLSSSSPPPSPASSPTSTLTSSNDKTHDPRLWIETFWFLIINAVTGYIFLFRGFEWVQEPGRVQRFMW